jgi:hypothetical protein
MKDMRWEYSTAESEYFDAMGIYVGSTIVAGGGAVKLGFDLAVRRASPVHLAADVGIMIGGLIAGLFAGDSVGVARSKCEHFKAKYYAAKQKYDECMLSALPDDTG